jgi:ABC-type transport system involved in multi-copper enzyme maturation permease subunit
MNTVLALSGVVIKELCRRKDFYVLFVLTALITLVMGSVNFFNDDRVVRYLKEICLLLIWISSLVIAITTTARQIPQERENRTIFPLLAKPVTRAQVVLGKFLGCWLACGLSLVVFYAFFGAVAAAREHQLPFFNYFQAILLHWSVLGIIVAMSLFGSIIFAAPSSNSTIIFVVAAGILLLGRHLNKVAATLAEPAGTILSAIYFAIPHLEIFDVRDLIVHNWPPIGWDKIGLAVLYAAAYGAFFLLAAWLAFRRKPLN